MKPDTEEPAPTCRRTSTSRARSPTTCSARQSPRRRPARWGAPCDGRLHQTTGVAPGRNVVAILPGTDPALRERVRRHRRAQRSHRLRPHAGRSRFREGVQSMRAAPQGADSPDPKPTPRAVARRSASTMDSLRKLHAVAPRLDLQRRRRRRLGLDGACSRSPSAFATARVKPKRSILFVWHVGEEDGHARLRLLHRPSDRAARLDRRADQHRHDRPRQGDGRHGRDKEGALLHGGPGYLQLIGSRRLSTELGDMVER